MLHNLFNRFLRESKDYEHLEGRLTHLEKEVDRLSLNQKASPKPHVHTTPIHFPPTITINLNKKEEGPVTRTIFAKKFKKPAPNPPPNFDSNLIKALLQKNYEAEPRPSIQTFANTSSPSPAVQATANQQEQHLNVTPVITQTLTNQTPESRQNDQPVISQIMSEQNRVPSPTVESEPAKCPPLPPTHTTYIEFLNVENLFVERYEQSNNFGALGIKSLEGKLNIGANYGDLSQLSDEAKSKVEETLKQAEIWKEVKKNKTNSTSSPTKPSQSSKQPPFNNEEFVTPEALENWFDWDNFFDRQPKDSENNKKQN